jgi:hypothetical protein
MRGDLQIVPKRDLQPAFFAPTAKAAKRVLEFFTAQISNDNTRRAYLAAAHRFGDWCAEHGIIDLSAVEPFHVAAFLKDIGTEVSAPSVKQHLAALRMLFEKPLESRTTPMDTCFDLRPGGQGPCQGSRYRNPTFTGWCAGAQRRPESQRESATTRFARPGSPRI